MLSRRLLRVKVMQMVYAHTQQGDTPYSAIEKELQHSVLKAHELYHYMLLLPIALKDLMVKRIENGRSKLRPTKQELNPNTKFINNKLIAQLEKNVMLKKFSDKNGLWWTEDDDLLKSICNRMCKSEMYESYMADPNDDFETDSKFIIKFLNKELPLYDFMFDALETKSIYWNDEAEFIISIAIKTLKLFDGTNGETVQLAPIYKDKEDEDFTKLLLRSSLNGRYETVEFIKRYSKNWDSDRVTALDVLIIQMAIAEMTTFKAIPIRVTLNEYIEIAKCYSTEKSHLYINGVLEKIVRFLVEKKRISPLQLK